MKLDTGKSLEVYLTNSAGAVSALGGSMILVLLILAIAFFLLRLAGAMNY